MVINCDWLSFSILLALTPDEEHNGAVLYCPLGYRLIECSGTNIYKRRVIVMRDDGAKYLTLLLEPHNKRINKINSCLVEVANQFLYADFSGVMDVLFHIHSFSFQSISRYDLACDFNPDIKMTNIIEGLGDMRYYVSSKRDGSMFFSYASQTIDAKSVVHRKPRCISWGSKYSNIRWKLYNKRDEIMTVSQNGLPFCSKPYIFTSWLSAGMTTDDVWRLEVSIVGASKFEWHGEKLNFQNCSSADFFFSLYCSLYHARFKVKLNGQKNNRRYDDEVEFLPLPLPDAVRLLPKLNGNANTLSPVELASVLHNIIIQFAKTEVAVNEQAFYCIAHSIIGIVQSANLSKYFAISYGLSIKEFEQIIDDGLPFVDDRLAFIQANFSPKLLT